MSQCQHNAGLQAYLDGELSVEATEVMAQHLRQCPSCAVQLDRLRALATLLASAPRPHIPDVTLYRLHMRVDRLPAGVIRRTAEALAAMAAMVLIGCTIAVATMSRPAGASQAVVPVWEVNAITQTPEQPSGTPEEQLAMWMAQDLSRERNQ
jgi:anti-sigma factor RsiW